MPPACGRGSLTPFRAPHMRLCCRALHFLAIRVREVVVGARTLRSWVSLLLLAHPGRPCSARQGFSRAGEARGGSKALPRDSGVGMSFAFGGGVARVTVRSSIGGATPVVVRGRHACAAVTPPKPIWGGLRGRKNLMA